MIIQRILNNKNFRNGALFALFSFFNTGINFVIMMVMARFIKPDSYGQLSLFTTMVSLLSIFICLNTNGFIGVNFFSSSKEKIQRLLNVVVLTTLLTYMVMLTAMCCFTSALEEVSGLTIVYQFYAISFCALNVMNALLLDVWRLEEKVWRYGTFSVLLVICNLILTFLFYFPGKADVETMFVLNFLKSLAYAPTVPLLWAMIADVADYSEYKNYRRATGFVFAGVVFALKAGLGIGGAILGFLLSGFGYVSGIGAEQSGTAIRGIVLSSSLIPAMIFGMGVAALCFYPITKKYNEQMQAELADRRSKAGY